METREVIKHTLGDYQSIIGPRSYVVHDNMVIQSAPERNYFYKYLRFSSKVSKKCEECTEEAYENTRKVDHRCVYSYHAGFIRWTVPVQRGDLHCVTVNEGALAMKQMENAGKRAKYLSKEYRLDRSMLLKSFRATQMMDEDRVNASIELPRDLLPCHLTMAEKQAQRPIFMQWRCVRLVRESLKG